MKEVKLRHVCFVYVCVCHSLMLFPCMHARAGLRRVRCNHTVTTLYFRPHERRTNLRTNERNVGRGSWVCVGTRRFVVLHVDT